MKKKLISKATCSATMLGIVYLERFIAMRNNFSDISSNRHAFNAM